MDYYKLVLIREWLENYYSVYKMSLDTSRYVSNEMNDKIMDKVFSFQKKDFKKIVKESRKHDREIAKQKRILLKNESIAKKAISLGNKKSFFAKRNIRKKLKKLKRKLYGFRYKRLKVEKVDYSVKK